MNISLTPKLEKVVQDKVKSGLYTSSSEVIREGLRLLEERDRIRAEKLEALKREVQLGVEQIERGEAAPFDPAFYQAIIDEERRKRA
jgi:antitoxin ParD1/3/4